MKTTFGHLPIIRKRGSRKTNKHTHMERTAQIWEGGHKTERGPMKVKIRPSFHGPGMKE